MIGNIPRVNNPLTVIAIFAGLSEVAMTVSLGLLEGNSQFVFMWFAGGFPTLIAAGFFGVLIFSPELLYGPTDWKDEKLLFEIFKERNSRRGKQIEELSKKVDEIIDAKICELNSTTTTPSPELEQIRCEAQEVRRMLDDLQRSFAAESKQLTFDLERNAKRVGLSGSSRLYYTVFEAVSVLGNCTSNEVVAWITQKTRNYSPARISKALFTLVEHEIIDIDQNEDGTQFSVSSGTVRDIAELFNP
ncbi:hypothetical protein [Bremerella alba]|uniref:Uncharacterized protein n=1 Tax=Bremerella alba TaxID=980252 RepID=A0A7V9A8T8_9BACT|nr:hypothetical protein [Bremerella alba]MBA2116825.1 hypothetical protein [Bremerella alba]